MTEQQPSAAPASPPASRDEPPPPPTERETGSDAFVPVEGDDTRSLRERGPLLDAEGDDIREYTGEPVETDQGVVIPQQQNVGPGNQAGGGEYPDPRTPPTQR
ncbi:MAG: hypothetical protein ACKVWR_19530 [Acidimicrobiales bacterium]